MVGIVVVGEDIMIIKCWCADEYDLDDDGYVDMMVGY